MEHDLSPALPSRKGAIEDEHSQAGTPASHSECAPVAVFAYKRPDHLRQTLEALSRCERADRSRLVIYSDGPKTDVDASKVEEVRRVARERRWCAEVDVVEQERNRGLANSVITGVTQLCADHGRAIVVEDDLIVSPHFLAYMNDALDRYADEPRVMQVAGYMFDVDLDIDDDALMLPFTTSWGWATWKQAWDLFDPAMGGLEKLQRDPDLRRKFNLDGAHDYYAMLENQRAGTVDSWAIRWYLSVFMREGLALFPKSSLVQNIGFDGSGTHGAAHSPDSEASTAAVAAFPSAIAVSSEFVKVVDAIRRRNYQSPIRKVANAVRSLYRKALG